MQYEKVSATVTIKSKIDDKNLSHFSQLDNIEISKIICRKPLKFNDTDIEMFVLGAQFTDDEHNRDYFCCPDEMWWTNGLDDQEYFSQTFRLFKSIESIKEGINKDYFIPNNAFQLNIYSLFILDNDISLKYEKSIVRSFQK